MEVYYSLVYIIMLLLAWNSYTDCSKVKLLERQIQQIAGRQFLESVSRQEDTSKIVEALNDIESRLNTSQIDFQCCEKGLRHDSRSASTNALGSKNNQDNFERMMKSFKEEKEITHRLRRQVPEIKKKVNRLDKDLINITYAIKAISSDMCTSIEPDNSLHETKRTVANLEELLKPILEDFVGKLNNLSETMQTLSAKVDEMYERSNTDRVRYWEGIETAGTTLPVLNTDRVTYWEEIETAWTTPLPALKKFPSCLSHYNAGRKENGIYTVYPQNTDHAIHVYCDMVTDGGGWTVFQRRKSGLEDFYLGWTDYKQGFGNLTDEFWLGNDNIAALTRNCCHTLRVDLEDFYNNTRYAKYDKFQVLPESENYKLIIGNYSGNAGDSLEYHNKTEFTTLDRDNDRASYNCAERFKGAWWYGRCHYSNLNGVYLSGITKDNGVGVNWFHFTGRRYSLKMTEMKIR